MAVAFAFGRFVNWRADAFIYYLSVELENEFGINVLEENESIYLGLEINKGTCGFTEDGNIPDGPEVSRA